MGYDYMAYMEYMDPDIFCPKKVDKHNLSLFEFLIKFKWSLFLGA